MADVQPVRCACGGEPHTSEYRGSHDQAATVFCGESCGITVSAGPERMVPSAIVRWNKLQEALKRGGWKG